MLVYRGIVRYICIASRDYVLWSHNLDQLLWDLPNNFRHLILPTSRHTGTLYNKYSRNRALWRLLPGIHGIVLLFRDLFGVYGSVRCIAISFYHDISRFHMVIGIHVQVLRCFLVVVIHVIFWSAPYQILYRQCCIFITSFDFHALRRSSTQVTRIPFAIKLS